MQRTIISAKIYEPLKQSITIFSLPIPTPTYLCNLIYLAISEKNIPMQQRANKLQYDFFTFFSFSPIKKYGLFCGGFFIHLMLQLSFKEWQRALQTHLNA